MTSSYAPPSPIFRHGTTDDVAWQETVVRNNYFLPDRFEQDDIVLDVGAHIGCFSIAALQRGAGRVWAYEADEANFALAVVNLSIYGDRAILQHAAIWRSDEPVDQVYFGGYRPWKDKVNTGGGDVLTATSGTTVSAVAFDRAIDMATDQGSRRVRFVKFDCEGSEYPILLTSQRLHLVDEIAGEYHVLKGERWSRLRGDARVTGFTQYIGDDIRVHLERNGFRARIGHCHPKLGQFMAWRQ